MVSSDHTADVSAGKGRDAVFPEELLLPLAEEKYAAFQRRLIPDLPPERIIGVRTPALRRLAAQWYGTPEAEAFLAAAPHTHFEENQFHAFLICREKDFGRCLAQTKEFLPHLDNWATCDQLSPPVFARHRAELLPELEALLDSPAPYTVRFAVGMLMQHFLDDAFDPALLRRVAAIRSEAYYVRMEAAWYFATALAKQWDAAVTVLENGGLDPWTHRKTIQKARESFRISPERKSYLESLK